MNDSDNDMTKYVKTTRRLLIVAIVIASIAMVCTAIGNFGVAVMIFSILVGSTLGGEGPDMAPVFENMYGLSSVGAILFAISFVLCVVGIVFNGKVVVDDNTADSRKKKNRNISFIIILIISGIIVTPYISTMFQVMFI